MLLTEPYYANLFTKFGFGTNFLSEDLGGNDHRNRFGGKNHTWGLLGNSMQMLSGKCVINKPAVDSFLTTAGRSFVDDSGQTKFEHCLWISTTNRGSNAEEAIRNHTPAVSRISLFHLQNSVDWDKLLQGVCRRVSPAKPLWAPEKAIANSLEYFKFRDRGNLSWHAARAKPLLRSKLPNSKPMGED